MMGVERDAIFDTRYKESERSFSNSVKGLPCRGMEGIRPSVRCIGWVEV